MHFNMIDSKLYQSGNYTEPKWAPSPSSLLSELPFPPQMQINL